MKSVYAQIVCLLDTYGSISDKYVVAVWHIQRKEAWLYKCVQIKFGKKYGVHTQ